MGGSGTGGYVPPKSDALHRKIEKAREDNRIKLEADVNRLLHRELVQYNDRDVSETQSRLESIKGALGEGVEVDSLLFGGSVAKHTYVDGLSDVDALVVLDQQGTQGLSAQGVLDRLHDQLDDALDRNGVHSIDKGRLAVTIHYRDGSEVQLLPAVREGQGIKIPDASGQGWKMTNPQAFQRELTRQNQRLNSGLIPTIKLVKSLVSDLPEQQRLTGYHIESLALDAANNYRGPSTPKALLDHVLGHAEARVRTPIRDVTGQSRNADDYLGARNSAQRRLVSQALGGIRRRLNAATSTGQWQAMFDRSE